MKLENSFLIKAHFAILMVILDIRSVVNDKEPLKILFFFSFQIDYKIANDIMLYKIRSHPTKRPPNQDSVTSRILFWAAPWKTTPVNLLQTLKATSHWREIWSRDSSLPHVTRVFEILLDVNHLLLRISCCCHYIVQKHKFLDNIPISHNFNKLKMSW